MTASTRLRPPHEQSARQKGASAAKSPAKSAAKPPAKSAAKSSIKAASKSSAKAASTSSAKRRTKAATPAKPVQMKGVWGVYILRCVDGSLYTGCTNDRDRRLGVHGKGGVKYTRGRLPVAIVYWEVSEDKSAALRREAALKRLSRGAKLALCG